LDFAFEEVTGLLFCKVRNEFGDAPVVNQLIAFRIFITHDGSEL
jgi:hypothetical protein